LFGAALLAAISGCAGYQVGTQSLFRPQIRTVYVPVFESISFRPHLGEWLTEAVVKEIELRTPYKVVSTPNADSVLTGRILFENKRVLAESEFDDARNIGTSLAVQVSWYDRRGDVLMQDTSFALSPLSLVATQDADFIPESGQSLVTANQETMRRLASQIVSQMEAPW
jgi:hypothetical protein